MIALRAFAQPTGGALYWSMIPKSGKIMLKQRARAG
jgi:hypothetical protein